MNTMLFTFLISQYEDHFIEFVNSSSGYEKILQMYVCCQFNKLSNAIHKNSVKKTLAKKYV